jgi:hypothetical protein
MLPFSFCWALGTVVISLGETENANNTACEASLMLEVKAAGLCFANQKFLEIPKPMRSSYQVKMSHFEKRIYFDEVLGCLCWLIHSIRTCSGTKWKCDSFLRFIRFSFNGCSFHH